MKTDASWLTIGARVRRALPARMSTSSFVALVLWVVAVVWAGGWWTVLATVPTTCSDGPCADDTNSMAFTFLLLGTPPLVLVAILATAWAIVAAIRRRR